jgi:GT2 family glycosyltransferase
MNLSVVIASYAKTEHHRRLTEQSIRTASRCGITDIIVVETMPGVVFKGAKTIEYPQGQTFCYNRALNIGITECKNKYIALCNNDLVFHYGFEKIAEYMEYNDILSASPYTIKAHQRTHKKGNHMYYGYRIGYEFCGWCIVIDTDILPMIGGKLDETYSFWFSDNAFADQLKKAGIKHALMCNVSIDHIESATLKTLPKGQSIEMTLIQEQKYRQNAKSKLHAK